MPVKRGLIAPFMLRLLAIAGLGVLLGATTIAGEKPFELRDHLGVAWRDELVTFTFEFPRGECHPESLRLQGPSGPISVQIVRSRPWADDDSHLQQATVGFFADLAPLATNRYVLSWGSDAAEVGPLPPSGLSIRRSGQLIALASHAFGAVFQTGSEEFTEPVVSSEVPGPVREMLLPDGRRFGGSRMYGPTKLTAWSGEVLAEGPVFADIRWRYRYEDGTEFLLRGRLGARDTAIYWDMSCRGTLLNDGWELLVSNGLPPLSLSVQVEHFSRRTLAGQELKVGDLISVPIVDQAPGKLTSVTPWADWTNDFTQTVVVLENPDRSAAFFSASRDPGVWIEPQTDLTKEISGRNQKSIPLVKNSDGSLGFMAGVIDRPGGGLRRWMTGVLPDGAWEEILEISKNEFTAVVQRQIQPLVDKRQLDRVKEFVLEWPEDPDLRHPMLIVKAADIERCRSRRVFPQSLIDDLRRVRGAPVPATPDASDSVALATWLLTGSPQAAADTRIVERLRHRLGLLGNFDLMRSAPLVATLYDGVIDSGLVRDDERRLLRARMAFLAYRMEDPATWSAERGFNTGLPNMNVAFALGRGIVAAALSDHPRAAMWSTPALERMDNWLENTAGSRGEWIEGASYDHVAASTMLAFAIAAKNAGFRDYSRHEKFRLLIEYIAKQYTPPDPTRKNLRVTPPLGRANAGLRMGLFGVMARFCRDEAPAYSAEMQWMWRQTGSLYPLADNRLCGLEYLYIDPELPGQQPQWTSEWYPRATAVLRNKFGTADEDYVNFLLHAAAPFARASEPGSLLSWFAFGKPVAGAFVGGYAERHELLMSRVVPAMSPTPEQWRAVNFHKIRGDVKEFSSQPQLDYIDAEYTMEEPSTADWSMPKGMPAWPPVERQPHAPIPWRRQVAFVKGAGEGEPSYLVLRDTVSTDQPTQWQFWTLSNGIAEAGDPQRPRGVIPDRFESRALRGTAFTAFGQQGVDLDFFVLEPAAPAASTLRWGTTYRNPPDIGYGEWRDLLQIRLSTRGRYTVLIIPRIAGTQACQVQYDRAGGSIHVRHPEGTDRLAFRSNTAATNSEKESLPREGVIVHRIRNGVTLTPTSDK